MSIETATGRSKCTNCQKQIPQGDDCLHLGVNSRANPFICAACIAQWHRLLEKETKLIRYEVWDDNGTLMAKKSGEEGWLCEVTHYDQAAEQIALAEGQPSQRCQSLGRCGWAKDDIHHAYLLEVPIKPH